MITVDRLFGVLPGTKRAYRNVGQFRSIDEQEYDSS
jgi:hypothetical protein